MLFVELVNAADRVASTSKKLEKIGILGELLARMSPQEAVIAGAFLTGGPRQGRIGIGPALLHQVRPTAADTASITLDEVDASLGAIAGVSGSGSGAARAEMLSALLARATAAEQDFLRRLLFGELRQGALEGVVAEAVAKAAKIPAAAVRRALMVSGSLGEVAAAAIHGGESALSALGVELFRPLQPMLAQTASTVTEAIQLLGEASLEAKLDGARVQVHKSGSDVRVFSRRLNDVTIAVPEVVEAVSALPARELILDGEVIALRPDGTPHPFQVTMRRFGRKLEVNDGLRGELPLSPFFFDCLWLDGASLLGAPQRERVAALAALLPPEQRVERLVTADPAAAEEFLRATLERGHEGVMAKGLDAPYEAGSRGASWLKIKQAKTLDLVILAVEWGSGRRHGWLSNLHLGARDPEGAVADPTYPEAPGWVMLGKTFKGLTDEMLAWQTERLLAISTRREKHVVYVRPEVVVEIAYNDLQESSTYPGGLALRFARVKGYRHDKRPQDADTIATVREAYTRATGLTPP